MHTENEEKAQAISLVTRKALVTFGPHTPIAIPLNGTAISVQSAIIEYQEPENHHKSEIPHHFTIIGITDGKKLKKGIQIQTVYSHPYALVHLDEEDFQALQNNR